MYGRICEAQTEKEQVRLCKLFFFFFLMRAYVFYVQVCVVAYVSTFACLFMPEAERGVIVGAPAATEL